MRCNEKIFGLQRALRRLFPLAMGMLFSSLTGCVSMSCASDSLHSGSYALPHYAVELTVRAGDAPVVILPQNSASTGYVWIIDQPASSEVAVLTGRMTLMPQDRDLVGVTGGELLQFKALHAGGCTFRASYVRPWDNHNCLPAMEAVITLDVR